MRKHKKLNFNKKKFNFFRNTGWTEFFKDPEKKKNQ